MRLCKLFRLLPATLAVAATLIQRGSKLQETVK